MAVFRFLARLGLAHALWVAGRRAEAVRDLRDMLRLNPNDNQGVRYTLAGPLLWDTLVQAMQHPAAGEAHRPGEIQVRPGEPWESLRPHFEEIGVGLVAGDELGHLAGVFDEMIEHVCGKPRPGLLDMPRVTPEQVGGFYEAGAFPLG